MNEEKKLILDLLKDGKVTSEQALLLLDALRQDSDHKRNFSKIEYKKMKTEKQFEDELKKFSKSVEKFSDEMGFKFKEVEPKLKEASKKVVNRTSDLLNELASKIDDFKDSKETNKEYYEEEKDCCQDGNCDEPKVDFTKKDDEEK